MRCRLLRWLKPQVDQVTISPSTRRNEKGHDRRGGFSVPDDGRGPFGNCLHGPDQEHDIDNAPTTRHTAVPAQITLPEPGLARCLGHTGQVLLPNVLVTSRVQGSTQRRALTLGRFLMRPVTGFARMPKRAYKDVFTACIVESVQIPLRARERSLSSWLRLRDYRIRFRPVAPLQ